MLQGNISQEIEKTLQRVVVLSSPIFSSSPNDIVGLNLKKVWFIQENVLYCKVTVFGQLNSPKMMWLSRSTMVFLLMLNCRSRLKGSAIVLLNSSEKEIPSHFLLQYNNFL